MHLIAVVVELKEGRKVVILNNKRVYVSTEEGPLEPGSASWLWSMPPVGSRIRGCAFYCGSVTEAPQWSKGF
jgi:hypothetical protein